MTLCGPPPPAEAFPPSHSMFDLGQSPLLPADRTASEACDLYTVRMKASTGFLLYRRMQDLSRATSILRQLRSVLGRIVRASSPLCSSCQVCHALSFSFMLHMIRLMRFLSEMRGFWCRPAFAVLELALAIQGLRRQIQEIGPRLSCRNFCGQSVTLSNLH